MVGDRSSQSFASLIRVIHRLGYLVDIGLGSSDPQWAVWFDAVFPQIVERIPPEPDREFIVSDARMGLVCTGTYFSCYNGRRKSDIYKGSITPKLGGFVLADKVVVIGNVDDQVEPPEGAKVFLSKHLKRLPKDSDKWVTKDAYISTYDFD
ncbi:hypothetical protein DFJ73DRAFT_767798 [Zopfochytrium polystomum]|nr:hypothetical protein DFJ73DRAFT_767798 [Zopfochytrium polystomum]